MLVEFRYRCPLYVCLAFAVLFAGCSDPAAIKEVPAKAPDKGSSAAVDSKPDSPVEAGSSKVSDTDSKPADTAEAKSKPADPAPVAEATPAAKAAPATDGFEVSVADDAIKLMAPASWKKVKPRSFVVEYEIQVPKSEGEADDAKDGRLTIMGAGGSIEANLDRWYGQYTQPDGSASKDAVVLSESTVAGCKVTWFDLSGTMIDKPGGPFAGGASIEREDYRTLAAIIQAGEDVGQYFVKVYGPKKTIADNEAAFKAFVESLTVDASKQGL